MLSTSLRSATQATDSTWSGWTAKSAATNALRQRAPVIRARTTNRSAAFAGVQQHVHEVVAARVEPEQLDVEHVREPGQRVPVAHVERRERPDHPAPGEPPPARRGSP